MTCNTRKGPIWSLQAMQASISLHICKSDLGLCCLPRESMDIVVYVDKQRLSGQTAQMHMLIWTYTVPIWNKGLFRGYASYVFC